MRERACERIRETDPSQQKNDTKNLICKTKYSAFFICSRPNSLLSLCIRFFLSFYLVSIHRMTPLARFFQRVPKCRRHLVYIFFFSRRFPFRQLTGRANQLYISVHRGNTTVRFTVFGLSHTMQFKFENVLSN